eukprot:12676085-Alexandrium_andersonii.AAC.1
MVGLVSVVFGSVDRFGSIDICLRSTRPPGGSSPLRTPKKHLRRARQPVIRHLCEHMRRIHPSRA